MAEANLKSWRLNWARKNPALLYFAAGVAAIASVIWYLQFSTRAICCGDFDGYYHARWSRLLWEGMIKGEFPPRFTFLPLTTLNPSAYVDHHFLFHILQIPFTWFADEVFGAKVGAWLFSTLGIAALYWLVVRYRLSYPLVWLIALFAASNAFLFRINMTKAMSLSLVLMVAGIYLLFERKYIWLAPLAFLYVWTYSLWVLVVAAAVIWTLVVWWSERRFEWRAILWTSAGALLGFVINPYFPHNISLFVEHVVIKATAGGFSTEVGNEWYPYNSWEFLDNCLVAFLAMACGYIAFNAREKSLAARPLFLLIFSTLLLLANFRSRRWAEYWPPFAVLFAAFALQPVFDRARERKINNSFANATDENLVATRVRSKWNLSAWKLSGWSLTECFTVATIVVALGAAAVSNVWRTADDIRGSAAPEQYRAGMKWVQGNVRAGELIFNANWDDFPKIFYYDTWHAYVSGLDPTYLLDENRDLAKLYTRITRGEERDAAKLVRERFGARYVFLRHEDSPGNFQLNLMKDNRSEKIYDDKYCTIIRLQDDEHAVN
ncbi:MAG: hypothetical protein H0V88_04770 [Pyrinomonadaceae bacterium]|nr:hypothetical protein [Pyrinomonadaceae bacterium]